MPIRRITLRRGNATPRSLGVTLDALGIEQGKEFTVEAEVDGTAGLICQVCGAEVDSKDAWIEYTGLARPPKARGQHSGSSLVDRQPTGAVYCGDCAYKRIRGVPLGQESFTSVSGTE